MMRHVHLPLLLDLVEWVGAKPRTYSDVMDAWRTSCPQLAIWEEAVDSGYLERRYRTGAPEMIILTDSGQRLLMQYGRKAIDTTRQNKYHTDGSPA